MKKLLFIIRMINVTKKKQFYFFSSIFILEIEETSDLYNN